MRHSDIIAFSKIIPISAIRKNINELPKSGGVYKHYVDKKGLDYFNSVHPITKEIAVDGTEVYLLYIGKAKNLFDRFKWHLGFSNTSHQSIVLGALSTLRLSYMANHKGINCLSEQNKLNKFMDEHTYAKYMTTEDFDYIEKKLIKEAVLPLNIKDNSHPFIATNKINRKAIRLKYKGENTNSVLTYISTAIKTFSKTDSKRNNLMIEDKILREYARKAEQKGITNKSNFLRWFRDSEQQSAAQNRLYKAWDTRNSDILTNK